MHLFLIWLFFSLVYKIILSSTVSGLLAPKEIPDGIIWLYEFSKAHEPFLMCNKSYETLIIGLGIGLLWDYSTFFPGQTHREICFL